MNKLFKPFLNWFGRKWIAEHVDGSTMSHRCPGKKAVGPPLGYYRPMHWLTLMLTGDAAAGFHEALLVPSFSGAVAEGERTDGLRCLFRHRLTLKIRFERELLLLSLVVSPLASRVLKLVD